MFLLFLKPFLFMGKFIITYFYSPLLTFICRQEVPPGAFRVRVLHEPSRLQRLQRERRQMLL